MVFGLLSEVMIKNLVWEGEVVGVYGSGYGILIVFIGVIVVLGGVIFFCRRVGWM